MKYVTPKYEKQLSDLAETLVTARRFGDAALQDTVECEAVVLEFPGGMRLKNPPEHGWELPPAA